MCPAHDLVHSLNNIRMLVGQVMLLTSPFLIGYFDQVSGILISEAGKQRVADMLPLDYVPKSKNP